MRCVSDYSITRLIGVTIVDVSAWPGCPTGEGWGREDPWPARWCPSLNGDRARRLRNRAEQLGHDALGGDPFGFGGEVHEDAMP